MICVDLSKSMDAFDIQPTRLEKIKFEMKKVVENYEALTAALEELTEIYNYVKDNEEEGSTQRFEEQGKVMKYVGKFYKCHLVP